MEREVGQVFIIAQIPFVDVRLLLKEDLDGCFFPNTFNGHYDKARYYRFLGSEKNRFGPNGLPMSERTFFNSRSILYNKKKYTDYSSYLLQLLFARFFTENYSFHFDIGIRIKTEPEHSLDQFAKRLLEYPFLGINDKCRKKHKAYSILGVSEEIKKIYIYATSSKRTNIEKNYSPYIILGAPELIIIYDKREQHFFASAKKLHLDNGIIVRHDLLSLNNTFADVWYIGKESLTKYNQDLRNLRIYLSKVHVYKEATHIMLNYLDTHGNKEVDLHKIGTFFNYMLARMERQTYYGYNNKDFWELAFNIDNEYNYASWQEFNMRIKAKLGELEMSNSKKYTVNNSQTFTDNVIVDSTVVTQSRNVFISKTNSEFIIKEALREFSTAVDDLIKQNPQLSEEQEATLRGQADMFMQCAQSIPQQKTHIRDLWKNVKKVFCLILSNAEGIERVMNLGEKVVGYFK